ncbi:hypothetical protein EDEG_01198 [Edhazardia aedis USNM 41457]|uniref:Uncharacterized protein n=1 Tax=Edhazardia aedis (strain USNM 41457) TaxID=1003232 RepID=J9DAV3_EDHAE|nr:hypothetical protein EDEG_01198 [Edhazardia aedis USNM 41457]|eukprot:EJW04614.1 hypothetical protein EDEG_01198 [Edhazardia aedis USNM 41457]
MENVGIIDFISLITNINLLFKSVNSNIKENIIPKLDRWRRKLATINISKIVIPSLYLEHYDIKIKKSCRDLTNFMNAIEIIEKEINEQKNKLKLSKDLKNSSKNTYDTMNHTHKNFLTEYSRLEKNLNINIEEIKKIATCISNIMLDQNNASTSILTFDVNRCKLNYLIDANTFEIVKEKIIETQKEMTKKKPHLDSMMKYLDAQNTFMENQKEHFKAENQKLSELKKQKELLKKQSSNSILIIINLILNNIKNTIENIRMHSNAMEKFFEIVIENKNSDRFFQFYENFISMLKDRPFFTAETLSLLKKIAANEEIFDKSDNRIDLIDIIVFYDQKIYELSKQYELMHEKLVKTLENCELCPNL